MKISSAVALLVLFVGCKGDNASPPAKTTTGPAVCGDGIVETGEACDWGAVDGGSNGAMACKNDCSALANAVSVEGDVLAFWYEVSGPRLTGAKVSILERPGVSLTAGDDAHFRFDNLAEGDDLTLVVQQSTVQDSQSATWKLGPKGIDPFPVQVVPISLFNGLVALVPLPPELDTTCAIATTVARMGGSLYAAQRQGYTGVTVTLDPPVDPSSGPLYFNPATVPSKGQLSTSVDGGVFFYRVPPGNYVMRASESGSVFNSIRINCRAGMIVNGGPPMGILANVANPDYGAGIGRPDDSYSAASDTLCTQTASCTNEADGGTPTSYPAATLASCKANYRNSWAFVDPTCDATAKVRDAAVTFYACRSSSCANVLGDDTFCAAEDTAFRAAETAYGACVSQAN